MADQKIIVELDDDGDVVRMKPAAAAASPNDTVTYHLSTKDGTDWQWVGYVADGTSTSDMIKQVEPVKDPNGGPDAMRFTLIDYTHPVTVEPSLNLTLLYRLTLKGAIDINNKSISEDLIFNKSFDPMIVFR